ncbi:hypothetical protein FisN_6Hu141 [Fistulifera solaris]|uniref:CCHC-type domain-containing protein n=1 Tax=Fistulifera solaris TaxID=1519565 RepID=A0A1Z5JNF5_FISSO|nr:hypothetical protein FisN_6Hu141 [Fistulifera solaris]|eukprot:GAX15524.1 hypothetical protein FisN_6Hu141 [Fistulifera solaris]
MTWSTRFTRRFPARLPIMGAPMANHVNALNACEVCRAGGLGFLAAGHLQEVTSIEKDIEEFRKDDIYPLSIGFLCFSTFGSQEGWKRFEFILDKHRPAVVQFFAPAVVVHDEQKDMTNIKMAHKYNAKVLCQTMSSPVPEGASPSPAPAPAGRGGNKNRGGKGGRGNGAAGRGVNQGMTKKFRGSFKEMDGHVFELPEEANDPTQFTKTKDKLKEVAQTGTVKESYMELASIFQDPMKRPEVKYPEPLPADASDDKKAVRAAKLTECAKREMKLETNNVALHAIMWGQTSAALQGKIKTLADFDEKHDEHDCVWLLTQIKAIIMNFDDRTYPMISEHEAKVAFYTCEQGTRESPEEYMKRLKALADVVKHCGGSVTGDWKNVPSSVGGETARKSYALDCAIATAYLKGLDRTRYGRLLGELKNDFAKGNDNYPQDLASAFALVNLYEVPRNESHQHQRGTHNQGGNKTEQAKGSTPATNHTFVQGDVCVIAGNDGRTYPDILCYNCNSYGHYSGNCNEPNKKETTLLSMGFVMAQQAVGHIDKAWILLDTQSSVSVFNNKDYLSNIRDSGDVMRAITNGGHQDSHLIGDFPNLGPVWYNQDSIANILSVKDVRKVCRITMDTSVEPALIVHRLDGSQMRFEEHDCGLYVFKPNNNQSVSAYSFVLTVEETKKLFTKRQVELADEAQRLYKILNRPGHAAFEDYLRNNRIHNSPVTVDDARRAVTIYGPDVPKLKGTTTAGPPPAHVPDQVRLAVPMSILLHHDHVTLAVDYVFVNKIPFLVTISRNIGWRTIAPVPDRSKTVMLKEIRRLLDIYRSRGLPVTAIHGDNEFACLRDDLGPVVLDIVAPNTHVPEIERSNRTIKERARTTIHGLPYKKLPTVFIRHLMMHVVNCLNIFPWKYGVSKDISPETIMTGSPPPDYNKLKLEFGTYAQVYDAPKPSNTPRSRTHGAIALNSTGNAGGAYYFMSLASGELIVRHQWTVCRITEAVVNQVELLATQDKQPLIQKTGLIVEWGGTVDPDAEFGDLVSDLETDQGAEDPSIEIDDTEPTEEDPQNFEPHIPNHDFPDNENENETFPNDDNENGIENADDDDNDHENNDNFDNDDDEQQAPILEEEQGADNIDEPVLEEVQGAGNDEIFDEAQGAENDTNEGADPEETVIDNEQGATYHLRNRASIRPPARLIEAMDEPHSSKAYETPTVLFQTVLFQAAMHVADEKAKMMVSPKGKRNVEELRNIIFERVFAQLTAKAAIKLYGEDAVQALMNEFAQLEDLGVFMAMHAKDLTAEQKRAALRAINLVTKKRDGRIKGRTVADGSVQKDLYDKSQTASPTVSTDALLLSLIVDAHEGRDVAIADVVGAYLKANMADFTLLKFTGESVNIMCKMNPKYEEFVAIEGGKRVLYVQLLKALYGCVCSALLWYEMFAGSLVDMGFELNPYDSCIANKKINGKQCTIAWYVDDMKVSHVDPEVVTQVIKDIEAKFGKMSITRGKKHKFLGMDISLNSNRTVEIQMKDYLQESIDESGLDITREATTPARSNLFDIDEESEPLVGDESEIFRSVVAKLLYVATRGRMDILLPVSFLCTRVTKSTKQDQAKLKRVLEYIKGSIDLTYTLGADSLNRFHSWVDAAFAVHPDMKSHTGGITSLGNGGLMCKSSKQKLNTKSSTEAELVGASDYLPHTMWTKMFMEAQGHKMEEIVFEQDNESAIRMETNGLEIWALISNIALR